MQIKRAQLPKRLMAFLICTIMLLSMCTQIAFAWTPPVANGSEGVGTAGGTTAGTFNESLSGYRVSVISRTGEMVKKPIDFLFSDRPAIAFGFSNNKWGHSTGGEWKKAPPGMPKPIVYDGNTFQPNGAELRNWIMGADSKGNTLAGFLRANFGYTPETLQASLKDIKIVFEPVFFWRLQSLEYVTTNGANGKSYVTTWTPDQRVYGTITEISAFAEAKKDKLGNNWNIVNGKQVKGRPVYGGNAGKIVVNAGPNALITDKDDTELGIMKAKPEAKMLPEYVTELKNGIGLHIYDFGEAKPEIPITYSWDFPLPDPGPAPDPKDIPKLPDEPIDKTRIYNIVKTYRDRDTGDIVTHVATYKRTNNPAIIVIQDEPEYKVKEWFISTAYNNPSTSTTWEDNHSQAPTTGPSGTKPNTTTVIPVNTTLYILLEKEEIIPPPPGSGDLTITESQVTKAIETMTSPITNWGPKTMNFTAADISGSCPEIEWCDSEDCGGHRCGNPYELNDTSWNYNHKNSEAINKYLHADIGNFKAINDRDSDATGNRGTVYTYNNSVNSFNYKLVVWRGKDIPTMASYKESSGHELKSLVNRYGKTPQGKRYDGTYYTDLLKIVLDKDAGKGDYTTTSITDHGYSKTATHSNVNTLSYDATAKVEVYWGKAHKKGNETATGTQPFQTTLVGKPSVKYSGGQMKQGSKDITWYPYIRMTYQTTGKKDPSRTNVNILSQWLSELTPNDYVEAAWASGTEYNLNLRSAQWSLHNKATSGEKGWNHPNRVLPGGAIYTLDTKDNKTWASVISWQPYLEDEIRNKVIVTGAEYDYASTKDPHNKLAEDAKNALENWRVVQYVKNHNSDGKTDDLKTNTKTTLVLDGIKIAGGGQGLSGLTGLTGNSSVDDKYYMKPASSKEAANEGDLDIISTQTIEIKYKVTADVEGKIHVYRDRDNSGWIEILTLNKNQGADDLTGEVLALDQRTKIITNLCTVLTRNTGNDKTTAWAASDGHWYNEAFDGICYIRQETCFELGYKAPTKRTAALDPALCAPNLGQSDLFSKAFLSQFFMNDKSDAYISKDNGYIGSFKGTDVTLAGYKEMFKSMPFAIPNVNVQDLH